MSGFEALGVACSIMQVISFSGEVIRLCKAIYQDASPQKKLAENAATLMVVFGEAQTRYQNLPLKKAADRDLMQLAERCNAIARALDEEVRFITANQKAGSFIAMLKVAAKTTWRKKRLERLENSLKEH